MTRYHALALFALLAAVAAIAVFAGGALPVVAGAVVVVWAIRTIARLVMNER